jgi:Tetratricopeptide repeat
MVVRPREHSSRPPSGTRINVAARRQVSHDTGRPRAGAGPSFSGVSERAAHGWTGSCASRGRGRAPSSCSSVHSWLGNTCRAMGDYETADHHLTLALELSDRLGDRGGEATGLNNVGTLRLAQGEIDRARDCRARPGPRPGDRQRLGRGARAGRPRQVRRRRARTPARDRPAHPGAHHLREDRRRRDGPGRRRTRRPRGRVCSIGQIFGAKGIDSCRSGSVVILVVRISLSCWNAISDHRHVRPRR